MIYLFKIPQSYFNRKILHLLTFVILSFASSISYSEILKSNFIHYDSIKNNIKIKSFSCNDLKLNTIFDSSLKALQRIYFPDSAISDSLLSLTLKCHSPGLTVLWYYRLPIMILLYSKPY